jgi:hypothetical protein
MAAVPLTFAAILLTPAVISFIQRPTMSVRSVSKKLSLDAARALGENDTRPGKVLLVDFATSEFCERVVQYNFPDGESRKQPAT